jgi:hypothetical protein
MEFSPDGYPYGWHQPYGRCMHQAHEKSITTPRSRCFSLADIGEQASGEPTFCLAKCESCTIMACMIAIHVDYAGTIDLRVTRSSCPEFPTEATTASEPPSSIGVHWAKPQCSARTPPSLECHEAPNMMAMF